MKTWCCDNINSPQINLLFAVNPNVIPSGLLLEHNKMCLKSFGKTNCIRKAKEFSGKKLNVGILSYWILKTYFTELIVWTWFWNKQRPISRMRRTDSFEKTLMLEKIEGRRRRDDRGWEAGWRHRLNGHEFEQAPGVGDGQGGLACCSPWGRKESDTTEQLNWSTELI